MGKQKKDSKKEVKKEIPKVEVIIDANAVSELKSTQKTPQELLNEELIKHASFNEKVSRILKNVIIKQQATVNEYKRKSSKVKSVSVLKKLVLKVRRLYEVKLLKNKAHTDELDILNKQVDSNIKELQRDEHTRENIVKFLKIPYKKEYQQEDIDNVLKIIENKETSKTDAKSAIQKYKKRLTEVINSHHETIKLNDFIYKYFKVEEKYNPTTILESQEMKEIQKQNEEIVHSAFKLLKSNIEITLLIDQRIKEKEHSKLFINFLKELKQKMDEVYDNIGQKELKRLLDEIKEDDAIKSTQENMDTSKEKLEKTVDEEIEKGNKEIEKSLIDATPKEQKK